MVPAESHGTCPPWLGHSYYAVVFLAIKIHLGNNKIGIIYLTLISSRAVFYFLNTVLFYFGNYCQGYQVNSATYSVPHWNVLWQVLEVFDQKGIFPTEWCQSSCISNIKCLENSLYLDRKRIMFRILSFCTDA